MNSHPRKPADLLFAATAVLMVVSGYVFATVSGYVSVTCIVWLWQWIRGP